MDNGIYVILIIALIALAISITALVREEQKKDGFPSTPDNSALQDKPMAVSHQGYRGYTKESDAQNAIAGQQCATDGPCDANHHYCLYECNPGETVMYYDSQFGSPNCPPNSNPQPWSCNSRLRI